ncbi:MAG: hypothetical protein AAB426_12655 [Myxococcota bacterium]
MRRALAALVAGVTLGGCFYTFPDPHGGTAFLCDGDQDCADGFRCMHRQCLDEAVFGSDAVTVAGTTGLPGATVSVSLLGKTFTVPADAGGEFVLDIPVGDGTPIVSITATGSPSRDESWVELASVLGDTGLLAELAGADRWLVRDEHRAVDLGALSTMKYGALYATLAGREPGDRLELALTERDLDGVYLDTELGDGAAALSLLMSDPALGLPGSAVSTLDIVRDPWLVRALVSSIRAANPDTDVLGAALAALSTAGDAFAVERLPAEYDIMTRARHGTVGVTHGRLRLDPGGTGTLQYATQGTGALPSLSSVTWTLANGALAVELDTSFHQSPVLDASVLGPLYADPTERAQVEAATVDGIELDAEYTHLDATLLARGQAVDWVRATWRVIYHVHDAVFAATAGAVTVPDAEGVDAGDKELWRRGDAIELSAPTPAVGDAWVLPLALPLDMPLVTATGDLVHAATVPVIGQAVVTFQSGTAVEITGGLATVPVSGTWQIINERLQLSYDGSTTRIGTWTELPTERGIVATHEPGDGTTYLVAERMVPRDAAWAFEAGALFNTPTQYWQTTVNLSLSTLGPDGALPPVDVFGFQFSAADGVVRRTMLVESETTPGVFEPWLDDSYRYSVAGSQVDMRQQGSADGLGPCDELAVVSCYVRRWRTWQVVGMYDGWLYVIESERIPTAGFAGLAWDDVNGTWLNDKGLPVDVALLAYFIPPRLNAYYVADIP